MTQATFCDIHPSGNNAVPKDRTMSITIQRYSEELGHKVGRKGVYIQAKIDGCNACINDVLLKVAKSHGVDIENMWKIEQLVPPKKGAKTKKWSTIMMSPDEFVAYQEKRQADAEKEELELQRAEQVTPRVTK